MMPRSGCLAKSAKLLVVRISHCCPGSSIHREKVALLKAVFAIIFQNPDSMVRLENTGIVEIVAVHIQNVHAAVAVKIMHGEVHRTIHRRKPRQYAVRARKISSTVIL